MEPETTRAVGDPLRRGGEQLARGLGIGRAPVLTLGPIVALPVVRVEPTTPIVGAEIEEEPVAAIAL